MEPIYHSSQEQPNPWFLREPSVLSKGRLFCIPYSGCGANMYQHWPEFIGDIEVCPIQLPGRENRFHEPSYTTYEALADDLADALTPYMDRPFAFFGHCGSALPSYETTVRLVEKGGPVPARLFVSSQVAPHQGPYGRFLELTDDELKKEMEIFMRRMGGTPVPDFIDLSVGIMRTDLEANRQYKKEEPFLLPCPITAIGWQQDVEVDPSLIDGWREYGETTFRFFKGDHHQFLEAPMELLTAIVEDMERSMY
jgi:surfactin synthase thioesterase subunit